MSAVIVGSPSSGKKVLRRAEFTTERNGLETLNEIYTIRTADRATLKPEFAVLHKDFSTNSTKYERMSVENFSFREIDGDLTEMNVTFVGLTNSIGLPFAIVRLIPTPGAGIYGPNMVIEAEFLTDKTETQFIENGCGGQIIETGFFITKGSAIAMPSEINGKTMPQNPRAPFHKAAGGVSEKYYGYLQQSIACERRGIFLVARTVFAESRDILTLI